MAPMITHGARAVPGESGFVRFCVKNILKWPILSLHGENRVFVTFSNLCMYV